MANRFVAEVNETEALTGLERISGDPPLTAEQMHKRHQEDLARMKAEEEDATRNVDYPDETKPADASGDAARGKRG